MCDVRRFKLKILKIQIVNLGVVHLEFLPATVILTIVVPGLSKSWEIQII